MPPVAFERALQNAQAVHTVKLTAGQWYWIVEDGGYTSLNVSTQDNLLIISTMPKPVNFM